MAKLGHFEHGAHETLEDPDLGPQPERQQHEEEERRPGLGPRQLREDVRHHDEGEPRPLRRVVQLGLKAAVPEAVLRREVEREEAGCHDAAVLVLGDVMGALVAQVIPVVHEDGDVTEKVKMCTVQRFL